MALIVTGCGRCSVYNSSIQMMFFWLWLVLKYSLCSSIAEKLDHVTVIVAHDFIHHLKISDV